MSLTKTWHEWKAEFIAHNPQWVGVWNPNNWSKTWTRFHQYCGPDKGLTDPSLCIMEQSMNQRSEVEVLRIGVVGRGLRIFWYVDENWDIYDYDAATDQYRLKPGIMEDEKP